MFKMSARSAAAPWEYAGYHATPTRLRIEPLEHGHCRSRLRAATTFASTHDSLSEMNTTRSPFACRVFNHASGALQFVPPRDRSELCALVITQSRHSTARYHVRLERNHSFAVLAQMEAATRAATSLTAPSRRSGAMTRHRRTHRTHTSRHTTPCRDTRHFRSRLPSRPGAHPDANSAHHHPPP